MTTNNENKNNIGPSTERTHDDEILKDDSQSLTVTESQRRFYNYSAKKAIIIALLLSIFLIHLPLIILLSHHHFADMEKFNKLTSQKKEQVVMINLKDDNAPQRLMDISKPKVQKKPKQASAQSLYDSSVKEETVSRKFAKKPSPPGNTQSPDTQATQKLNQKLSSQVKTQEKTENPPPSPQPMTMQQQLQMLQNQQKNKEQQKMATLYKSDSSSPVFKTNLGSGGSPDEFHPDYKVGDRTYINTLANPHVAFFVELKRKFRFAFNPIPVLRYRLQEISSNKISVVWGISVDENGNMKGLTLIQGSGMNAYDYEAKRTITSSAPFTKPPAYLLGKDNMLHMAWTFVVYL